jgi:uncharacterized damage-inducible protein DinB
MAAIIYRRSAVGGRFIIHAVFSSTANTLADKLISEGERTAAFFAALPAERRHTPVYSDGAAWSVRHTLEHLILSERSLLLVFRAVAAGAPGAPTDVDVEAFNRDHTDDFAHLSFDELVQAFRAQRRETTEFARSLADADLARRGHHPALGDASLLEMLRLVPLHNAMHLRDVRKTT